MLLVRNPIQMKILVSNIRSSLNRISLLRFISSLSPVQESIKASVVTKNYLQIPELVVSLEEPWQKHNPFSFFSDFPPHHTAQVIDEMLQSFIPIRPRSRPKIVYFCLLSYTLQTTNPFPLSLAIIQRILRSGCLPVPQTQLLLSKAWLETRDQSRSVYDILLEMKSIGYHPDCGTCNYVVSSLCAVDQLEEAVRVLKGMAVSGCVPDLESYGAIISAMCTARRTDDGLEMVKQMVVRVKLVPRHGMVVQLVGALRANREVWRAVELMDFLEREGYAQEFESYESVVEGCVECREYILAGKVVLKMTDKGFIPYIKIRQKVVEGLAAVGEWKLACAVRHKLAQLSS